MFLFQCYGLFSTICLKSKSRDSCSVPLSKASLDLVQDYLFMCPWEEKAACLCWQQWYHPCSAPQQERREERGQLRKRADVERIKPVIAPDSAYPAKSITMPVSLLSILLASSRKFRHRTSERTRTRCIWRQAGTEKSNLDCVHSLIETWCARCSMTTGVVPQLPLSKMLLPLTCVRQSAKRM